MKAKNKRKTKAKIQIHIMSGEKRKKKNIKRRPELKNQIFWQGLRNNKKYILWTKITTTRAINNSKNKKEIIRIL